MQNSTVTTADVTAAVNNLTNPNAVIPAANKPKFKFTKTSDGIIVIARFVAPSNAQLSAISRLLFDLLDT